MSKADLIQNLGTIAYSGSAKFLEQANKSGNSQLDSLIGQFGVGFYSTFIVSEYVEVVSKNENSVAAKWTSDGSVRGQLSPNRERSIFRTWRTPASSAGPRSL